LASCLKTLFRHTFPAMRRFPPQYLGELPNWAIVSPYFRDSLVLGSDRLSRAQWSRSAALLGQVRVAAAAPQLRAIQLHQLDGPATDHRVRMLFCVAQMPPADAIPAGDEEHAKSSLVNFSARMNDIVTIIFQNTNHALFKGILDLSSIHYKSNAGAVIEALLDACGFECSRSGKQLWRRAEPCVKLAWRPPKSKNSRKPVDARTTTLGGLAAMDLEHDAEAHAAGTHAEQRAAEAARPAAPRALELAQPDGCDRVRVGSGWGNVPRALTDACVAEQCALDGLVHETQEHAIACGARLRRVHADEACWSCHSMGVVNVFRLQVRTRSAPAPSACVALSPLRGAAALARTPRDRRVTDVTDVTDVKCVTDTALTPSRLFARAVRQGLLDHVELGAADAGSAEAPAARSADGRRSGGRRSGGRCGRWRAGPCRHHRGRRDHGRRRRSRWRRVHGRRSKSAASHRRRLTHGRFLDVVARQRVCGARRVVTARLAGR
jgi:hypothetical protein